MKIIVDIPYDYYQVTIIEEMLINCGCNIVELPKGHGRLIDADELLELFHDGTEGYDCATYTRYEIGEIIDKDAPTVIEADKEE